MAKHSEIWFISPGFEKSKEPQKSKEKIKINWKENNQYIHEFYLSRLQKQRISKSTRKLSANETHITHELDQDHIKQKIGLTTYD